jgi:hypothetical protein
VCIFLNKGASEAPVFWVKKNENFEKCSVDSVVHFAHATPVIGQQPKKRFFYVA